MQFVKVTGTREIERLLLALPDKVAKRIGRKAVRTGMKPVLDAARANVPVREGRLRRALRLRVDLLRSTGMNGRTISALVYLSKSQGPRPSKTARARYSYQIGTRPDVYGKFVELGTVDTPPHPYMRPAWDAHGGFAAMRRMGEELIAGIEREAAGKV